MAGKAHAMLCARDASSGATLTSATINVYQPGTVTPVSGTLFDKNNSVLSNPLTSDAVTGLIDFYMTVAQEVDLVISKGGYTTRTYSNVPVLDDASNDLSALLTTTGDVAYASAANTPARLPIGSTGAFLTVTGGIPAWSNTIAAGGLAVSAGNVSVGIAIQATTALFVLGSSTNAILGRATDNTSATNALTAQQANGNTIINARGDGGLSLGVSGSTLGFFGLGSLVGRQSLPAVATDLASVIVTCNALRTALNNYNLIG